MISIFILVFLLSLFVKSKKGKLNKKENDVSLIMTLIIVLLLSLLSGLRSSIGDTGYYLYSYKYIIPNTSEIISAKDWGYILMQRILLYFKFNSQMYLILIALITIFSIILTLKKYSVSFSTSLFIFICSGIYISTMNGMRQYLVASIVFAATTLIIKNKPILYIILIIILSTIHSSVLIMIPVYFIVKKRAWSKSIVVFTFIFLTIFVLFNSLFKYFSVVLSSTQYEGYVNTFGSEDYAGVNILRILVALVPVTLSFILRNKIKSTEWNIYDLCTNFSLLNFFMILLGSYNWIFARIAIYFDFYNLLLIPLLLWNIDKKNRMLLLFILMVCYVLFLREELQPYIYTSYYLKINEEFIGPLTRIVYD